MKNNIWSRLAGRDKQKLNKKNPAHSGRGKPFFVLAPMAGVTDSPFRQIIAKIGSPSESEGRPDLFFTEFVSTEMIWRNFFDAPRSDLRDYPEIRPQKIPPILRYSKKEKPLIAQFFGCKPEQFRVCAQLAVKLGFDGVDINMGCPDSKVQKQGSGSELIKNPKLAREIVRAVKEGCGGKIPVSVKTRLGYQKLEARSWILEIAKEEPDAITIHGRTAKQGYSGTADWEEIGKITKEIKKRFPHIIVVGNGDVKDLCRGAIYCAQYGVDGVMIGREILHNPWVFKKGLINQTPTIQERLKLCLDHTKLFEKQYGKDTHIGAMKKYYKAYLSGTGVKKGLMECKDLGEAKKFLMSKL